MQSDAVGGLRAGATDKSHAGQAGAGRQEPAAALGSTLLSTLSRRAAPNSHPTVAAHLYWRSSWRISLVALETAMVCAVSTLQWERTWAGAR